MNKRLIAPICIVVLMLAYVIMLLNTNSVISYAEDIFMQRIPYDANSPDALMHRYYYPEDHSDDLFSLDLRRLFVWHNFDHGYMYVYYTIEVKDGITNELEYGSWGIPSRWEIKKIDGVWRVIDIKEDP